LTEISVIIPAYQAQATIERALRSIAQQTLKPAEIIIIDDGSKDKTIKVAKSCTNKLAGIDLKIYTQINRGAGAARNKALSEASYPIVAFLDADDEWLPEKLEISLNHIQAGNHTLVAHNGWIENKGTKTYLDIATRLQNAGPDPFHGLYRRGFISTSSVMAQRDAILEVGGFDETLRVGQDFDLWLKLLSKPEATFEIFDEPLTRYHITPGSITSQISMRLSCTLQIARRHAPTLSDHKGSDLLSLWFRILAVHTEALRSYGKRREFFASTKTLISLIYYLIGMPLDISFAKIFGDETSSPITKEPASLNSYLWAWVGLATLGYLFQFRIFTTSILNIMGIK
jgi:glycosyltransferase involved in cell wall biosynthesis